MLRVQALQDHDTVMLLTQLSLEQESVQKSPDRNEERERERERERRRGGDTAVAVARSLSVLLRPEMRGPPVKIGVAGTTTSVLGGENESRKRARSPPRNIQGRDHEDSDTPGRRV